MGAGKSTVGSALAEHLGWTFVDLDEVIERREQVAIPDLFRLHGEARFREMESATLRSVLNESRQAHVLALGGGTFVQPANVKLLRERSVFVVFLETPIATMLARCCGPEKSSTGTRPLAEDPAAFQRLYQQRLPCYRTADLTLSTEGRSAEELARQIALRVDIKLA
jgi:shikimate kinase